MKHPKYTILFLAQFSLCLLAFAQPRKVDSLNDLACKYANTHNKPGWDTAVLYINQAYKEAVALDYTKGIADALFNTALLEMNRHNYPASERWYLKCISYYQRISDSEALGWAYHNLGYVTYVQGGFDHAISNWERAISFLRNKEGSWDAVRKTYELLGVTYGLKGELEKGFELAQKGLVESQQRNDSVGMAFPLMIIGDLYQSMEDYPMAMEYYYASAALGGNEDTYLAAQMAIVHSAMHHPDSALYYYQKAYVRDPGNRYFQMVLGEIYLQQKSYNEALLTLQKAVPFLKSTNGKKELMRVLLDIAKVYLAQESYPEALRYAQEGLALAQTTGARRYTATGLKMLSTIYEGMGISKSAFVYLKQYISLKDSLLNNQLKAKLFAYKSTVENERKQAQIAGLNKEKLINQQQLEIKQQQLQRAALLKKILIGGSLALVLLGIIVFRNLSLKRRNEKIQSERAQAALQHKTAELEMQALRAQMNPHFIFNSLNSINRFILQNNKAQASEYLTKFSRLVRLILQNSQAPLITLESELEALQLYLELEALRFDQHFDFHIRVDEDVDEGMLKVPPLIIQPFAENAIWHGLMHKEEKGRLDIELYRDNGGLCCKIIDDGIGRRKAAELKSKSASANKSMGMRITSDRIALLQQQKLVQTSIAVNDMVLPDGSAGGTEVILKLPVVYD